MLVEGNSVRAASRMSEVAINTVQKLIIDIGEAAAVYQDEHLRELPCKTIEADEIWSFVYPKAKNVPEDRKGEFGVGDVWTWTALDADHQAYTAPVGVVFKKDIDWALNGDPDPAKISTSYVERQNLTTRMGMRRFTRLINGSSKKVDNHMAAIALHLMHYNFARPHTTLANPHRRTPAMAAGIADHVWTMAEIAALLDSTTYAAPVTKDARLALVLAINLTMVTALLAVGG